MLKNRKSNQIMKPKPLWFGLFLFWGFCENKNSGTQKVLKYTEKSVEFFTKLFVNISQSLGEEEIKEAMNM